MKEDVAIRVEGLSKKFLKNGKPFWALKDINFEVRRGETLGVIGANGSGKSTLLKILSDILRPTEGFATIKGSCASVLDIGSGFHPDLSGLENIKLKADILGFSKQIDKSTLEEIIEFSGLSDSIHEPVKNYSNGMFVRLAFSIFKVLKQEIMLVDEVLSAGDLEFQNKIRESGFLEDSSGIIVSHELDSIADFCDRIVSLKNGRIVNISDSKSAIEVYRINSIGSSWSEKVLNSSNKVETPQLKVGYLSVTSIELLHNADAELLASDEFSVKINVSNESKVELKFAILPVVRTFGQTLDLHGYSDYFEHEKTLSISPSGVGYSVVTFPKCFFGHGNYSLGIVLFVNDSEFYRFEEVAYFTLKKGANDFGKPWDGVNIQIRKSLNWKHYY